MGRLENPAVYILRQDGDQEWKGEVCLPQEDYARTIEPIVISKSRRAEPDVLATTAETQDNRSALGALGWLATQSRPDIAASVALSQRNQATPTVGDLIETNRIIKIAVANAASCLVVPKLTGQLAFVTYHDASWANADEETGTGILKYVKMMVDTAKAYAKKGCDKRMKIRSQVGYLTFLTDGPALHGPPQWVR